VGLKKSVKLSGRQKDLAAKGVTGHAMLIDMQPTILDVACSNRDAAIIDLLLAAGAEVGPYALHDVASSKQAIDTASLVRCFSLLIEASADIHAPGWHITSNTPLHEAADAIAARALINAGVNVKARNKVLRCKSVLQVLIVTLVDYCRLARLRACIYRHLLAR
jgi:hypothetical protein